MNGRKLLLNVIPVLQKEAYAHFAKRLGSQHSEKFFFRIKRLFDYTLSDGKCARGELALNTFQTLAPNATSLQLTNAAKVAASIEVLQSFFLIVDDVVDHSLLRRGKPCWHTLPGVGLKACIDGLLLESAVDVIIRNALRDHPRKYLILDDVFETKAKTITGQELDMATKKITDFSWELYRDIVEHKTSHYTYYFPLLMGFQLADESANLAALQKIAYKLGYLFQAQDDYLDAFGDSSITGKSSNDFSDSKCTWLVCALLDTINNKPEKMRQFVNSFGLNELTHIETIRRILKDEKIDIQFQKFEFDMIKEIKSEIVKFPIPEIQIILNKSVERLVNRKK